MAARLMRPGFSAAGQPQPAALGAAVDEHPPQVDLLQLAHDTAQNADVLMQPYVVHALGRTVQPGDDVPGHGGAQKAAGVHAVPSLAGAIHGDQRHAHPGKGGLLGK